MTHHQLDELRISTITAERDQLRDALAKRSDAMRQLAEGNDHLRSLLQVQRERRVKLEAVVEAARKYLATPYSGHDGYEAYGHAKAALVAALDGTAAQKKCEHCHGRGTVRYYHGDYDTCPTCHGTAAQEGQ